MDQLIWMLIGAGGLAGMIVMRLAAKHGFAWVRAELKSRASAAEAEFRARVTAAAAPFEERVKALETSVAAIKAKIGG